MHIESVHEGKRIACSLSDYIARRKGDLVKHIQTVHEKTRYKCEMCEFSCSVKYRQTKTIIFFKKLLKDVLKSIW